MLTIQSILIFNILYLFAHLTKSSIFRLALVVRSSVQKWSYPYSVFKRYIFECSVHVFINLNGKSFDILFNRICIGFIFTKSPACNQIFIFTNSRFYIFFPSSTIQITFIHVCKIEFCFFE